MARVLWSSRVRHRGRAILVGFAGLGLVVSQTLVAVRPAEAATSSVITSCTYSAVSQAVANGGNFVFGCSGTIDFPLPIVVSTKKVSLSGSGQSVVFESTPSCRSGPGAQNCQLFDIAGAGLTVVDLTLQDGVEVGAPGGLGIPGTPGQNGGPGAAGTDGTDGGPGGAGAQGLGGAVFLAAHATLTVAGGSFSQNRAAGGAGGAGGNGGLRGFGRRRNQRCRRVRG
jgi:hypothetical protein